MEMEAEAERKKCAQILEAEGSVLGQANRAEGVAVAILIKAEATAHGIKLVSEAMTKEGSTEAASLGIAEQYIEAFADLSKTNNTILLPSDSGNMASLFAHALKDIIAHSPVQPRAGHAHIEVEESEGETGPAAQPSETSNMTPAHPALSCA
uniref:STML2-like C-terminal extension domain-containing protein n=1 Tax=Arundo donax TaxID=35708 RepID=A0A0A9GAE8_ARUDO